MVQDRGQRADIMRSAQLTFQGNDMPAKTCKIATYVRDKDIELT